MPLFYSRSSDGLPRGWVKMMKRSMGTICPFFNTNRVVQEYVEKCYWPSAQRFTLLTGDNLKKARELAEWRRRLSQGWPQIRVEAVEANAADPMHVGAELQVQARVNLGSFTPDDVQVQLFHGVVDSLGDIPAPRTAPMSNNGPPQGNAWTFNGSIPCRASGQYGYIVRVLPKHAALANPFEPGLVCWG